MIATYSEAHRQLNRILDFFFFGCVAEILLSTLQSNWWSSVVWLVAAVMDGLIGTGPSQKPISASIPADELANELVNQQAFAGKFVRFTNLLAATVLAAGFAFDNPWWANLLAAVVAWFASMFGILLLCAPRTTEEEADTRDR